MSENTEIAENSKQPNRLGLVILPFIMMLVVGFFVYPAFMDLRLLFSSYRWEVTEGRLEEASIETISLIDVGSESRPDVRYTYSVDGQDYTGTRLYFGNEPDAYSGWEIISSIAIDPYRNVSNVNVYYNPDNPAQSVLERRLGIERGYQWVFVVIIIAVLIGYIGAIFQIAFTMFKNLFSRES